MKPNPIPEWMDQALCAETNTEVFFPDNGASFQALAICKLCDVRAECLEYALTNNETAGVWGGMSATQRRHLRRRLA